jgi:purine-binding chemotaxis protein CheW
MKLHIVFVVAGVEYALPVELVLQMESFGGATAVPGVPDYVVGIVSLRGRVIPVVDLRRRFGLPAVESTLNTRMIVTELAGRVVALRVDAAREVVPLDPAQHQPAPDMLGGHAAGMVRGTHTQGSRLFLLLDLPQVLGDDSDEQQSHALVHDGASEPPALPG